jgi:hypothetical protein
VLLFMIRSDHELMSLFEHDLRANAFRVCREGKRYPLFQIMR